MKHIKLLSTAVIAAFAIGMPLGMNAADAEKEKAPAKEAKAKGEKPKGDKPAVEKKARPTQFHGVVSAVDKTAKTFTIATKKGGTVYSVNDETKITNKDAAAKFEELADKAYVTGSFEKDGDKNLAKTLKLGQETPVKKEKAEKSDKPADKTEKKEMKKKDKGEAKPADAAK